MKVSGNLYKMKSVFESPVCYYLQLNESQINLNELIGRKISLTHNGIINCIHCGKQTKKSFNQGYCYTCFKTAPAADESVVRPELSMAQFGVARDLQWSEEHDLIDHYVYLAITNTLKVGVTRYHQIPTRWIDQGAVEGIKLAKTPNRHIAGVIENYLKQYVADKTQWQAMLKGQIKIDINLVEEKARIISLLPQELQKYSCENNDILTINYPGEYKLEKVKSLSFDKQSSIKGRLMGVKGQYLVFDNETVLNIRKHNGYWIDFSVDD